MGVWADLFLSGWASQTGLTNDLTGLATAGGISDSLMRPQGFCAHRDRGRRRKAVWWGTRRGKRKVKMNRKAKPDRSKGVQENRQSKAKEGTKKRDK